MPSPPWGLTATGFNTKPLANILSDVEAKELSGISASLDLQAPEPIGVLNGAFGAEVAALWELGAALYNGMDPDQATGDQETSLALITGTERLAATKTQVLGVTVNLNAGITLPAGSQASIVGNPEAIFVSKVDVTNSGGSPANKTVNFEALNAGPTQCLSGTLTVIAVPVSGWNSVTNPNDGTVGSNIETDPDLRLRRNLELSAAGATTAAAIRGEVLKFMVVPTTTTDTLNCAVLYNDTDLTDANGLPPHSIEVIAYQPGNTSDDDVALATLILNAKAAGIGTYSGNGTYKDVIDSQGNTERVYYTRPTTTTIYVDITALTTNPALVAASSIKEALVNYAEGTNGNPGEYAPGIDVIANALKAQVFTSPNDAAVGVPGVIDVTAFTLGTSPSPVGTANISIDIRHIATLSTGNITVTIT
jgi:hypothetical protein